MNESAHGARGSAHDARPSTGHPSADTPRDASGLVGQSWAMRHLREAIARHATHPFPVLISGETGTGKELVARALHDLGPRRSRAFVAVNAATLPRDLAASELFGHVRDAFTGAVAHRRGLVELAQHGTLFLDEIAELDLATQGALLRLVEQREVRPVGAEALRRVDVRIVAATHVDLCAAVKAGRFRLDLYHRLAVGRLHVPPLRERPQDLGLLARHLLERLPPELRRELREEALAVLRTHSWPGNVRELGNVLLRAALGTERVVGAADIRRALRDPHERVREAPTHRAFARALKLAGGSVSGAARLLGVPRSTFRDRLRAASAARS